MIKMLLAFINTTCLFDPKNSIFYSGKTQNSTNLEDISETPVKNCNIDYIDLFS